MFAGRRGGELASDEAGDEAEGESGDDDRRDGK
jgi:hypothetical protein